jgi:hypothetical protein
MSRIVTVLSLATALTLPLSVTAQTPQTGQASGSMPPGTTNAPPPKATPPGPHAVTVESYPSLATHTAYHPSDLGVFGPSNRLPIVSWGNGGCARIGTAFSGFLTQIASHGYLAISIGQKDAQSGRGGGRGPVAPSAPGAQTAPLDDMMLLDAVDWALQQNNDPSSPFHQKLDTTKIAIMGQSCGGLQTIAVSPDPRVTTSVLFNSGVLPEGAPTPSGLRLSEATKDHLARLHAPIAYIIGGPSDVAYPNAEDDFARITTVPVFKANLDVGHGGTFRDPGAGWFGEVAVAWLDWQLKGSHSQARYFTGAECLLCTNPVWSVEKKGMP